MSKAGFIERTPDEADRRINRIRITQKGKEVFLAGREECSKVDARMFSGITDEEIEKFSEILIKITENLSEEGLSEKEVMDFIAKEKDKKIIKIVTYSKLLIAASSSNTKDLTSSSFKKELIITLLQTASLKV